MTSLQCVLGISTQKARAYTRFLHKSSIYFVKVDATVFQLNGSFDRGDAGLNKVLDLLPTFTVYNAYLSFKY